ncbi:unnamed protein product, partial [Polarella glacialis]
DVLRCAANVSRRRWQLGACVLWSCWRTRRRRAVNLEDGESASTATAGETSRAPSPRCREPASEGTPGISCAAAGLVTR